MGTDDVTVSRRELTELTQEIQSLKQNPMGSRASLSLIEAMDRLATQVDKLTTLFEQANEELTQEYEKGFREESSKLDRLIKQNEKLARGILAVADLVQTPGNQGAYPLEDNAPPTTTTTPQAPQPNPTTPETASVAEGPHHRKDLLREFR